MEKTTMYIMYTVAGIISIVYIVLNLQKKNDLADKVMGYFSIVGGILIIIGSTWACCQFNKLMSMVQDNHISLADNGQGWVGILVLLLGIVAGGFLIKLGWIDIRKNLRK